MNKKLLAVAVAGALAAPGVALAQASSVTISGYFKQGLENLSYSNAVATRLNSSQMRLVDGSSQIHFNSVEDLGNGLSAIAQLDIRFHPDSGGGNQVGGPIGATGNTWVGLKSTTLGALTMGRNDLHYGQGGGVDMITKAGALQAWNVSLMDYIGGAPIANTTRTPSVLKYTSPNWNGLSAIVAWSANPLAASPNDMNPAPAAGTSTRKGDGWNINPSYVNGPFSIAYSYWRAKADSPAPGTNDQRGDELAGDYKFGGFKIGLEWNKSRLDDANTGVRIAERTAWSLPMSYTWGPNMVVGHYTRAGNISNGAGLNTNDTGARMVAVAYVYSLSKRTSLAATYAKINNDSNGTYNLFTSQALGSADASVAPGENPRMFQLSVMHAF